MSGNTTGLIKRDTDEEPNNPAPQFRLLKYSDKLCLKCFGDWTIEFAEALSKKLENLTFRDCNLVEVDTSEVTAFDTSGAWMVEKLRLRHLEKNIEVKHIDDDFRRVRLTEVVQSAQHSNAAPVPGDASPFFIRWVTQFGTFVASHWKDFLTVCYLIGAYIWEPRSKSGRRNGIRLTSIVHHLDHMGLRAIPVIALMSFLIGAIIAQQGAFQLQAFGEELLTVDLVGVLHFREIAVLLTAIMVAGRTGSAITAEIGTMKMREEIDAMTVIGLNPIGVLIFPRIIALVLAMPMLVLLSDIMGIAGAVFVSNIYVGITPEQFLSALRDGVPVSHLIVGLIKAPVMAIIVGVTASIEGLKVGGSAESLGQRTTSSVVRAIFAVILVDGLFAMFFTAIGY